MMHVVYCVQSTPAGDACVGIEVSNLDPPHWMTPGYSHIPLKEEQKP